MTLSNWTVRSSQTLIEDKWIKVRADRCVDARGTVIEPYYVLDYPSWMTVFPVTSAGSVVLVRQYRHGVGQVLLELPCGSFDAGEEDATVVARRELLEETGYTGSDFREIASVSPNAANHSNLSHIVIAQGVEKTNDQQLDISEDIEVVLMPIDQLSKELRRGSFLQAMHVAAIFYGLNELGY